MSFTGKPALTTATGFINDGFWPDLSVGDLLSRYRLPAEYADETIVWGLTLASINVNIELERVKVAVAALGHASLADYVLAFPEPINAHQVLIVQYENAVYCRAKGMLLPQFNSMNRRAIAEDAVKDAPETEQYWLDESQKSIAALIKHFFSDETPVGNFGARVTLL